MSAGLRHDAMLYSSDGEFVATLEPFVNDGLAADEPVIAVTTATNVELLREGLDSRAGDVQFIDAGEWYRRPLQTIAAYRGALDERLAGGARRVRVIGEVQFGDTPEKQTDWVRYEAALNRAFAASPAWIVCPYDERLLPPEVLHHATRTHTHILGGAGRRASAAYLDPSHLLGRLAAPPPEPAGPPFADLVVDGELTQARETVRDAAERAGLDAEDAERLTAAANEVLTNALLHGRAPVELRLFSSGADLHCEVADAGGSFDDPAAGYTPPASAELPEGGMGLWLARQLCDGVEVAGDPGRTVVRLSMTGCTSPATARRAGRR